MELRSGTIYGGEKSIEYYISEMAYEVYYDLGDELYEKMVKGAVYDANNSPPVKAAYSKTGYSNREIAATLLWMNRPKPSQCHVVRAMNEAFSEKVGVADGLIIDIENIIRGTGEYY